MLHIPWDYMITVLNIYILQRPLDQEYSRSHTIMVSMSVYLVTNLDIYCLNHIVLVPGNTTLLLSTFLNAFICIFTVEHLKTYQNPFGYFKVWNCLLVGELMHNIKAASYIKQPLWSFNSTFPCDPCSCGPDSCVPVLLEVFVLWAKMLHFL